MNPGVGNFLYLAYFIEQQYLSLKILFVFHQRGELTRVHMCEYLQGSLQNNSMSYITLLVNYVIKGIDKIIPKHRQNWVWPLGISYFSVDYNDSH